MYALLDLAERVHLYRSTADANVRGGDEELTLARFALAERESGRWSLATAARFPYRALKINMPWSAYRNTTETQLSYADCRNLSFWEAYLDMAAANKFNVLSIWSQHPFPYMLRSKTFPKATSMDDDALRDWQQLHSGIFKLAQDRNIAP